MYVVSRVPFFFQILGQTRISMRKCGAILDGLVDLHWCRLGPPYEGSNNVAPLSIVKGKYWAYLRCDQVYHGGGAAARHQQQRRVMMAAASATAGHHIWLFIRWDVSSAKRASRMVSKLPYMDISAMSRDVAPQLLSHYLLCAQTT